MINQSEDYREGDDEVDEILHTNPKWYRPGEFLNTIDSIAAELEEAEEINQTEKESEDTSAFKTHPVGKDVLTLPVEENEAESEQTDIVARNEGNDRTVKENQAESQESSMVYIPLEETQPHNIEHYANGIADGVSHDNFVNDFSNSVLLNEDTLADYSFELLAPESSTDGAGKDPSEDLSLDCDDLPSGHDFSEMEVFTNGNPNLKCRVSGCGKCFKKLEGYINHLEKHLEGYNCNDFLFCS